MAETRTQTQDPPRRDGSARGSVAASVALPAVDVRRKRPPLLSFLLRRETLRRAFRVITLLELAREVIDVCDSRSEIVHEALPTDDPQVRQPDITLAREKLGWEPQVELREGLQRTLENSGIEALTGAGVA